MPNITATTLRRQLLDGTIATSAGLNAALSYTAPFIPTLTSDASVTVSNGGDTITKNSGTYSYVTASEYFEGAQEGYVEFKLAPQTSGFAYGGLSISADGYPDYSFINNGPTGWGIAILGLVKLWGTRSASTVFRVAVEGGNLRFYVDNVLVYTWKAWMASRMYPAFFLGGASDQAFQIRVMTGSASIGQLLVNKQTAVPLATNEAARNIIWSSTTAMGLAGANFLLVLGGVGFIFSGTMGGMVQVYHIPSGARLANGASYLSGRYGHGAAGNQANAFVFGSQDGTTTYTNCDNYLFALPGTKGLTPSALAVAKTECMAANNASQIFVFGGLLQGNTTTTNAVEQYLFATPTTKGSTPANLLANKRSMFAGSNASIALIMGGIEESVVVHTACEQYLFATPASKGAAGVALTDAVQTHQGWAASNTVSMLLFGGLTNGSVSVGIVDHYLFATPSTKGATPVALLVARYWGQAVANATDALLVGGHNNQLNTPIHATERYLFANVATKGTPPAALEAAGNWAGSGASNRSF